MQESSAKTQTTEKGKTMILIDADTAVSRYVYEQVRWERDVAIEQLESYGVSLGEKAEVVKVVHGRWEKHGKHDWRCSVCKRGVPYSFTGNHYCHNCGAKIDLENKK